MKILIIGNIGSGKTTLGKAIQEFTGFKFIQIDELRVKYLQGKVSEEYYCHYEFLKAIEAEQDLIVEFTGVGCHKFAVKKALELCKDKALIIYCKTRAFKLILDRIKKKKLDYISPFHAEMKDHALFIQRELQENSSEFWKSNHFEFKELYMDNFEDLEMNLRQLKEELS